MNDQVTISLPEPILRQLLHIAQATDRSIESLITQSVLSNLPPSVENAPIEWQAELLAMQSLTINELQSIVQSQIDPAQFSDHTKLLHQNEENQLTPAERAELSNFRQAADQLMLRKAYACAVLRWRGHRIIAIEELPIPV
jgi:predicted transcriptional regulator